jgi:hypothetical protein
MMIWARTNNIMGEPMTITSTQLRAEVRDLLLDFDQSFPPGDQRAADASRHADRLRFALARLEELEHAAVLQSPLYNAGRLEVAIAILRVDIERARAFLGRTRKPMARLKLEVNGVEAVERAA